MKPERTLFVEEVELVVQDRRVRIEVESRPPPRDRGRFSRRARFSEDETEKRRDSI